LIEEDIGSPKIDSHQHFWKLGSIAYPWLMPADPVLYRDFAPPELEPQLHAAGIDGTVLVQAANSYADTEAMLRLATMFPWIRAVVGWAPLSKPREAATALDRYMRHDTFRGVRHSIHDLIGTDRQACRALIEGTRLVAERGLTLDVDIPFAGGLQAVARLAEQNPDLTIIIDHLAKPPIRESLLEPWATEIAAAAAYPNVMAKISGLATVADLDQWSAADLQPYIDHAFSCFGAYRLMFGSDWPVCTQAGTYAQIWAETNLALAGRSRQDSVALLGATAGRVYRLSPLS
jgi:L-fuconolactonase